MTVQLQLLGSAERALDGVWQPIPVQQSLLFSAYLAYREDWVQRDELLALFWPDQDEKTARHNLSQLLYHCRRQPWAAGLEAERQRVRWSITTDVQVFREAVGAGDWGAAVSRYRGELLTGVMADDTAGYQSWLEDERAALASDWREAALKHAAVLEGAGDVLRAAALLREVLRRNSLAEDVLQAYLRCAAAAGQRDAALRAYDAFRDLLRHDLDLEPLEATVTLAQRLRTAGPERAPAAAPTTPTPAAATRSALPPPRTSFVGRDPELTELLRLLDRPDGRLVTVIGPGGIGKTRLALEIARGREEANGSVVFVGLTTVTSAEQMWQAVAEALQLTLAGNAEMLDQIVDVLQGRQVLLLLDNVEHLLEAAPEVLDLLDRAVGVRVLATSREPLDLPGEVVFELAGLTFPGDEVSADAEAYDAVDLFVRSARRSNRHFRLDGDNRAAVVRLCRLLHGLPLGLELAAGWTRMLSPQELVAELERDLSLLESDGGATPARHRSLQAVFVSSWELLDGAEREALLRLSVFRGGFDHLAAQRGADVRLRTLLALVNKSLLQRTDSGRFERHLTVQTFSEERLAADPERHDAARRHHAEHYLGLARELEPTLTGPDQIASLVRLAADHDNLRAALRWQIDSGEIEAALELASALARFWWLRGHYREGRRWFDTLLGPDGPARNMPPSRLLARAFNNAGGQARLCEDYGAARSYFEHSLELSRDLDHLQGVASTLGNLALLDRIEGDTATARKRMERSVALYREIGDRRQVANTLNNLAAIAQTEGLLDEAERLNRDSLELARELGEPFIEARSRGNLADLLLGRGALDESERHYLAALEVFERMDYGVGVAVGYQGLGHLAQRRGDGVAACAQLARALTTFRDIGDSRGVGEVLLSFAELAEEAGDLVVALRFTGAALALHDRSGTALMPDDRTAVERRSARAAEKLGEQGHGLLQQGRNAIDESVSDALAYSAAIPVANGSGER